MQTIFMYFLGIMLSSIGMFFILLNLNLLTIGYSFSKYVKFIISNAECLIFFFGIGILILIYERGKL